MLRNRRGLTSSTHHFRQAHAFLLADYRKDGQHSVFEMPQEPISCSVNEREKVCHGMTKVYFEPRRSNPAGFQRVQLFRQTVWPSIRIHIGQPAVFADSVRAKNAAHITEHNEGAAVDLFQGAGLAVRLGSTTVTLRVCANGTPNQ